MKIRSWLPVLGLLIATFCGKIEAYEDGTFQCEISNRITEVVIKTVDISGIKMPYIEYKEKAQYSDSVGKGFGNVSINRAGAKPYEAVRLAAYPPVIVAWSDGVLIPGCQKTK